MPQDLHDWIRNRARVLGADDWVASLPELVATFEREWEIRVGEPLHGGTEAFVAVATTADGSQAVLKLLIPRDGEQARREIAALEHMAGRGTAKLLRADASRSAMLLERLGPSMFELGLPLPERLEWLTDACTRLWQPAPADDFPTGADHARELVALIEGLWEELGNPCSEAAIDHALACASNRCEAHDDERAVLVHGDVHQWNALRADDGFRLIDPDGIVAEPELDLGILMREDPDDLLGRDARARSRWLASRTGRDEVAIWEWGVAERVSTGLVATQIDLQPEGRTMLAVADQVAAQR